MPLQWRNQFWQSLVGGAGKRCLECGTTPQWRNQFWPSLEKDAGKQCLECGTTPQWRVWRKVPKSHAGDCLVASSPTFVGIVWFLGRCLRLRLDTCEVQTGDCVTQYNTGECVACVQVPLGSTSLVIVARVYRCP